MTNRHQLTAFIDSENQMLKEHTLIRNQTDLTQEEVIAFYHAQNVERYNKGMSAVNEALSQLSDEDIATLSEFEEIRKKIQQYENTKLFNCTVSTKDAQKLAVYEDLTRRRGRRSLEQRGYLVEGYSKWRVDLEITKKILIAIKMLSGSYSNIPNLFAKTLYDEAEKQGADSVLLSVIGSWGDILENKEILEVLDDLY